MCDHYDRYFPEDKEQRELNLKKQMEALKPIQPSFQQVYEEINHLKNKIKQLENSLPKLKK